MGGLFGSGGLVRAANTDNFTITNYKAEYFLGRDEENRSTLDITLTITADFPPNQNRGLAPVFAKKYDGHQTNFQLKSVTDGQGKALNYHWEDEELRIGDKDKYVEGENTYIIKYSQRDVTKYFKDTGKSEFYWDVIGVEWRVPIENAEIYLTLDDSIKKAVATEAFCYMGKSGSADRCMVENSGATYAVKIDRLARAEGVTFALGFAPETFAAYKKSLYEWWLTLQLVIMPFATVLAIWQALSYRRMVARTKELKPIPPEYLPPKNTGVMASSYLLKKYDMSMVKGSPIAAQVLDLAVRHYLKLYEVKAKTWITAAQYEIEIIKDINTLLPDEQEIIKDMFNDVGLHVGARLNLRKLRYNNAYGQRTLDDDKKLKNLFRGKFGLTEVNSGHCQKMKKRAIVVGAVGVLLLSPALLFIAAFLFGASIATWSLTDKGLALRRHLHGLKDYIGVAEEERFKILQSPEGAEKTKVDPGDERQLVKLYERVLPYAVLFGQEKEWSKQLGLYYEHVGAQPDWYSGQSAFNAAVFAAGIHDLSAATSSVSSYSSSSGGSAGGGFAGGGGGGGGGGGW